MSNNNENNTDFPTDFNSLINADSEELITKMMSLDANEAFNQEFMMWQELLSRLEPYKDEIIQSELEKIDMDGLMPDADKKDIYSSYYRLVETHKYLYSLHKPVINRITMLKDAIKQLRSAARAMFKGTEKDKDAHCDKMVRNFVGELSNATVLINNIDKCIKQVEFAAMQASRVIKEKEFQLKSSGAYTTQGKSNIFNNNNALDNVLEDFEETEEEDLNNPIPQKYRKT
jgi:hypothetical protein